MSRAFLLTLCLLFSSSIMLHAVAKDDAPAVTTAADDNAERDAILDSVKTAIAANDFAALGRIEEEFRSSRARTSSGIWKLATFHAGMQFYLADGLQPENGCQYRKAPFVQQWAAASAENPAPAITDAALLMKQAWCFRGSGFADSVPDEAWPKFRNAVAAAYTRLDRQGAMASIDPEYYAVKLDILRGQSATREAFDTLVEEAIAREPDYHRTYFNAAWYYLPQWGGSYAEVDAFARHAAERTQASEGDGLYARIFWSLDECGCHVTEKAADWSMMKRSMRDVYQRYPAVWNGSYFADLACRMGDIDEGHYYIRAIHPEVTDERAFAALFASCQSQVGR